MPATTTLEQMRGFVQKGIKRLPNGPASDPTLLDHNIKMAGDEFVNETNVVVAYATGLSLVSGTDTLDVSGVTDLQANRIAYVERIDSGDGTRDTLEQVDYDYFVRVKDGHRNGYWYHELVRPTSEQFQGYPMIYAFRDADTMVFYPVPDQAWDIRIKHYPQFTDWTQGTGSPAAVTLNIPDRYIYGVARGAAMYMDQAEPDALLNDPRMIWWRDFIDRNRGDDETASPSFNVSRSEY